MMGNEFNQHDYLLRTNPAYREQFMHLAVSRISVLVEALAVKNGISLDEFGQVQGLSAKDLKANPRLQGIMPGLEDDEVKPAYPKHQEAELAVSDDFDRFSTVPDPKGKYSATKVDPKGGTEDVPVVNQGVAYNPGDEVQASYGSEAGNSPENLTDPEGEPTPEEKAEESKEETKDDKKK
jgi:hypothetical protein